MNHATWLRAIYEVQKSSLTDFSKNEGKFKAVCSALAFHGNYETGTNVSPSWLTVSRLASVDRKFAFKVRDWLLTHGWLEQTGKGEGNIAVYAFKQGEVPLVRTSETDTEVVAEVPAEGTTDDAENMLSEVLPELAEVLAEHEQKSFQTEQKSFLDGPNTTTNTKESNTTMDITDEEEVQWRSSQDLEDLGVDISSLKDKEVRVVQTLPSLRVNHIEREYLSSLDIDEDRRQACFALLADPDFQPDRAGPSRVGFALNETAGEVEW